MLEGEGGGPHVAGSGEQGGHPTPRPVVLLLLLLLLLPMMLLLLLLLMLMLLLLLMVMVVVVVLMLGVQTPRLDPVGVLPLPLVRVGLGERAQP